MKDEKSLDVLVIGAGFSGIYALYALRQAGKSAIALEAGGGVGGTWFWNRYPGLVVDIESIEYSYGFSEELQQEWSWTSRYAGQEEIEKYLNHVVDRFDLRKDIVLNSRVQTMRFDSDRNVWIATTTDGIEYSAQYAVMGTGLLSAPKHVHFDGLDDFKGEVYKTYDWPREGVSFEGKRVGVVGTGASGIQVIPKIAEEASHLNVYQRTPTWAVPLRNGPIDEAFVSEVKANYSEWRKKERFASFGGWCSVNQKPIDQVFDLALETSPEEREKLYEDRWKNGGLAFYNVYPDIFGDIKANDTLREFFANKMRERINDPELERLLIPDYPILMRRLAGETNYYETYKRDNVSLIDLKTKPLQRFSEKGIVVGDEEQALDAVVLATGYDAMSGALMRLDIEGKDGQKLADHWSDSVQTVFGMMASGFPNMFYLSGPGSPAPLFQPVLFCQDQMQWAINAMNYVDQQGASCFDPTEAVEQEWLQECDEKFHSTLFGSIDSWYNAIS